MNVKKVFRAMTLLVVILAASISLNAQATKATDKKSDQKEATVLVLSPEKVTLEAGRPLTISIKEGIKEGEKIAINWKSSNEKVATVDKEGNVTAIAEGKTTITATAGERTGKCEVTVEKKQEPVPPTFLTLDPDKVTLKSGETQKLTVKGTDAETITWISSNEKVATVDRSGVVKAIAEGKAIITASAGKKEGKCEVIVDKSKEKE